MSKSATGLPFPGSVTRRDRNSRGPRLDNRLTHVKERIGRQRMIPADLDILARPVAHLPFVRAVVDSLSISHSRGL